jgi:hypothetical protein
MRGLAPSLSALRPAALSDKTLRRARLAATAVGGFLVPWSAVLAKTLPSSTHVRRWSMAWAGLDATEAVAALATSALLARGDRRAAVPAAAFGALVLADAWFDVTTSAPGQESAIAIAEAVVVEVPLAAAAFWLAASLAAGGLPGDNPVAMGHQIADLVAQGG